MTAGEMSESIEAVVLLAPAAVLRDDAIRGNIMGRQFDPQNPPEYLEMWNNLKLGRSYMRTAFSIPIYETAANFKGNALIIHGTGDTTVPYTYGIRFNELWKDKSELCLLDKFDHWFSQDMPRVAHLTTSYLSRCLSMK